MPELPEVETVRRGLAPVMIGSSFHGVEVRRPDLRFPLPVDFAKRLTGARVENLQRRGKYMLASLSSDETLVMHLGMSGRFTIVPASPASARKTGVFFAAGGDPKHDHVVFHMALPGQSRRPTASVVYNDPRRFGFMDLVASDAVEQSKHFQGMGPEPMSENFGPAVFNAALRGRAAPIKSALLDQKVVAGVGNIYACEALFRAGVSPRRRAASVYGARGARLHAALVAVLGEAIEAGGSSLRDFAGSDGALGYFQHRFEVYGREGAPCVNCAKPVRRIAQSGRSTFFCARCQR